MAMDNPGIGTNAAAADSEATVQIQYLPAYKNLYLRTC